MEDEGENLPFIQAGQFVLFILVPFTPPLEVVLIMEAATYWAPVWESLADVLPLHAFTSEYGN